MCSLSSFFFFFSSRRRHTRFDCDWSSDVCSSDLEAARDSLERIRKLSAQGTLPAAQLEQAQGQYDRAHAERQAEIGRASCRERVEISVVAVSLKKKKK